MNQSKALVRRYKYAIYAHLRDVKHLMSSKPHITAFKSLKYLGYLKGTLKDCLERPNKYKNLCNAFRNCLKTFKKTINPNIHFLLPSIKEMKY